VSVRLPSLADRIINTLRTNQEKESGRERCGKGLRFVWHPHRCQPRRRGRERELNLEGDSTLIPMAQHTSEQLWATTGGEEEDEGGKRRHREWVIAYTSSRPHICSRCGLVGREDPSGTGLLRCRRTEKTLAPSLPSTPPSFSGSLSSCVVSPDSSGSAWGERTVCGVRRRKGRNAHCRFMAANRSSTSSTSPSMCVQT
jgi:hypothetical protein